MLEHEVINSELLLKYINQIKIKEFRSFQYHAIQNGLLDGKSLLVSAPSGSGKTLVAELAIINMISKGKKAIYAAPYRAICNEKYERFLELGKSIKINVTISTSDFNKNLANLEETDLVVCTYERLDSLLRLNQEFFEKIGVVVIDEIHEMGESYRGARLEGTLTRIKMKFPQIQLVGLSATVANPDELANWLGAKLINSSYRPVSLSHKIVITSDKNAKIYEIISETLAKNKSILVFVSRRRDAESLALKVGRVISQSISAEEKKYLYRTVKEQEKTPEFNTRQGRKLLSAILKGVGFHHAGLNYNQRKFVESLFADRKIKVVVGTTTLGAGINTPASVVIIRDPGVPVTISRLKGNRVLTSTFLRLMPSNKIHQMLGRAGRPGYDDVGIGILLATSESDASVYLNKYFREERPVYERIESQISPTTLPEQILVFIHFNMGATKEELLEFFKHLFSYFQSDDYSRTLFESLLETSPMNLKMLLKSVASRDVFEKAEMLPDEAVRLYRLTKSTAEGEVDSVFCGFSSKPFCQCKDFQNQSIDGKLCYHLVKLGLYLYENHPENALLFIPKALNLKLPLDNLLKYGFVEFRDDRYVCTRFGQITVKLYLRPMTSLFIKEQLPYVKNNIDFLALANHAASFETSSGYSKNISMALISLLQGLSAVEVSDKYNIPLGDLESYIDIIKWLSNSILSMAKWMDLNEIASLGENVLRKLSDVSF